MALELMRHAVDEARARGDGPTVAERLTDLCDAFLQLERLEEAEACARETVSLVVSSSWESLELVIPHATAAEVLVRSGAPDAEALLVDAEQRAELHDHGLARPALLRTRALIALRRGELSAALSVLEASAAEARKQGALVQLGRTLAVLSNVAAAQGHAHVQQTVDAERTAVVERIGPHVEHLPWTASITTASTQKSLQKPAPPGPLAVLTPREQQVAALVARGLTDREIAEALIITEGTAGSHVGHILNKLGFRSRAQVAAWAAEHHLINVGDTSR
ncbi:MAG: response regulator transcription factor [Chloroflexi bacterium]|nr:response regulator transcription factor [Chloroflexota bacterium]